MVILDMNRIGLLFFIAVQTAYFLHFPHDKVNFCVSLIIILIAITAASFLPELYVLAFVYGGLFIRNLLSAYHSRQLEEGRILFLGLMLFALCDIHVALMNTVPFLYGYARAAIWFFYLPSQLLIALSISRKGVCLNE